MSKKTTLEKFIGVWNTKTIVRGCHWGSIIWCIDEFWFN